MSVARRAVASLTAAALGLAGLVVVAGPARAADTLHRSALTSFGSMAVDDVHRKVFLTGGSTSDVVEVRDFDGALLGTVTGQPGATGLAVAPDASAVYVALHGADAVSRLDPVSLTETARYGLGTGSCISSLAFVGARLFVGYGCTNDGTVAELDLAAPVPALGTRFDVAYQQAPLVRGSSGGHHLAVLSSFGVTSWDVAQDPPVATGTAGGGCADAAPEPTGPDVVTACLGAPYNHLAFTQAGMALSYTYPTGKFVPSAVAATDAAVAAGAERGSGVDVFVYARHTATTLRTFELDSATTRVGPLARRGLAFAADRSRLFAVSDNGNGVIHLRAFANPLATLSTMTLSAPASASRGARVTVTGTLAGTPAFPAGTALTVTRTDLAGTHALAGVRTTASGGFTLTDRPTIGGPNTYKVTYPGTVGHRAVSASRTVSVARLATSLSITTNRSTYGYGGKVRVTAHLGKTFNGRTVKIYARPAGFPRVLVGSRTVDASGNVTMTRTVQRRTTFSAVFPGDYRYAPRTVRRSVAVRAKVIDSMSNYASFSSGTYFYPATADPQITAEVSPNRVGKCIRFTVQRYSAGAWRSWASSGCTVHLDTRSMATVHMTGSHPRGYRFRIRAEYLGDSVAAAGNGAWRFFRFT